MLTLDERQNLSALMEVAYPSYAELDVLTAMRLGYPLDKVADDRRLPMALLGIFRCEEAHDQFERLLTVLAAYPPQHRSLQALAGDLLIKVRQRRANGGRDDTWYQPPSPFDTCFLQGRAPFFDRQPLRSKLQLLGRGIYRVLVINGAPLTGKSYSVRFLTFLARQRAAFGPQFRLADIDLKSHRSSQIEVAFLVKRILLQIDPEQAPQVPQPEGQAVHWNQVLAEWLVSLAEKREQVFCIALDHFDAKLLPDEVRQFIGHLTQRAMVSDRLRLVLVGYPGAELPVEAGEIIDEEQLGLPTDTDIADFFTRVHEHKNLVPASSAPDLARELMGKVALSREDPNFLPTLSRAAKTHMLTLFPG